jgi:transcriptional regulator with XRE-family HTH domain
VKGKDAFYVELGERIAEARGHVKNMTQERLARALGLSRSSIANIERGHQPVLVHTLVEVGRLLNVDPVLLLPPKASVDTSALNLPAVRELPAAQRAWVESVLSGEAREVTDEHSESIKAKIQSRKAPRRRASEKG